MDVLGVMHNNVIFYNTPSIFIDFKICLLTELTVLYVGKTR